MLIRLSDIDMEKIGIYKITNPKNSKFYIGSSSISFKKRFSNHKRLLFLDKNPCKYLQRVYNKNPDVDLIFEILEVCSKEDCIKREQYYIDKLKPKYNICKIAGSSAGRIPSELHLKNQFEAQRKFKDDEVIMMFKLYNENKKIKDIAKIFNCKSNNISSIINKSKKYIWVKNKYNLKIKNKKTKYKGKYLICTPFGEIHIVENLTRYAKQNNLEPSNLNRCANGLIKTTKGYKVKKYQACKDW